MSSPSYRGRQSDDDFQRHNAHRHHREGSGQDRLGALVAPKDAIYTAKDELAGYYYLKSLGKKGPLDGNLVNVKVLEQVGTTSEGETIWRSK